MKFKFEGQVELQLRLKSLIYFFNLLLARKLCCLSVEVVPAVDCGGGGGGGGYSKKGMMGYEKNEKK